MVEVIKGFDASLSALNNDDDDETVVSNYLLGMLELIGAHSEKYVACFGHASNDFDGNTLARPGHRQGAGGGGVVTPALVWDQGGRVQHKR
jgi:hypothetical protein